MNNLGMKIRSYDRYIVAFSGGKDSLACVLQLIKRGIPKNKIELWHHLIDGRTENSFMDWPVTEDYCRKVAAALKIPIFFSWRDGGFEREMLRQQTPTARTLYKVPAYIGRKSNEFGDNLIECGLDKMTISAIRTSGGNGPKGTRMKFPQVSADLSVRWCSAYLKIDVCTAAIRNQERFNNSRTLLITGERAEESPARKKYKIFEPDRSDNRHGKSKRHVDHYRPVHSWTEEDVWEIIKEFRINPHPAYRLGWGRLSCMFCIFGSKNQWASGRKVNNDGFTKISDYEREFGKTIQRHMSVEEMADEGTPYPNMSNELMAYSQKTEFTEEVILDKWTLPVGAFGDSAGPV